MDNYTTSLPTTTPFSGLPDKPITTTEWLNVAAFVLILCTGMVGNAFVMYVFGYKRSVRRRTTTEWLILYLGVIDFLSSALNPPIYIYWTITHYRRWDFGVIGCHLIPALGPIMTSISSGLLLIMAIERFVAIVSPFRGQLSWKMITVAFVLDIILATCAYIHYMLALEVSPLGFCYIPAVNSPGYAIPNCVLIVLRLFIFACIFTFTNYRIFNTLKKQVRTSTVRELKKIRHKQSKRITKVLLTMGIVFIVLVFPREIFYLVFNLSWMMYKEGIHYNATSLQINAWLKVAHTANSCANVFIYSHMHTIYRKQIFRMLTYIGCCEKTYIQEHFSVTQTTQNLSVPRPSMSLFSKLSHRSRVVETEYWSEEDETIFFQRAQKWKGSKNKYAAVFI